MASRVLSLRARLILVVTLIFVLALFVILASTFFVVQRSLVQQDRAELQTKLQTLVHNYELGGIKAVRQEIEETDVLGRERPFYVRVATAANDTLLETIPEPWTGFPFGELERLSPASVPDFHRLGSEAAGYDIEILTGRVEGGLVFQVGASTRVRGDVLGALVRTFWAVALPCLVVIAVVLSLSIHRLLLSITDITRAVRRVLSTGRYDQQVATRHASRETDELVDAFNLLMEKIDHLITHLRQTLNSLAHDIKTPMTRLRANTELVVSGEHNEDELRRALSESLEQSGEVIALLERFLDASEAESGAVQLNREEVQLDSLFSDLADAYGMVAENSGVGFAYYPDAVGRAYVDTVRLRQAVGNLLDNAVKFSPHGGTIMLAVRGVGGHIEVSVTDEGPGISPQEAERIWAYQYRGNEGDAASGYGLGLTIVRAVAEAHGGNARVEQNAGAGSTFVVSLPRGLE